MDNDFTTTDLHHCITTCTRDIHTIYTRTFLRFKLGDTLDRIIDNHMDTNGRQYPYLIALHNDAEFQQENSSTIVVVGEFSWTFYTAQLNAFYQCIRIKLDDPDEDFEDLIYTFLLYPQITAYDYRSFVKDVSIDNGQAKLLVHTLEMFVGEVPDEVNVLVIGSAGATYSRSGQTYSILTRILSFMGKRGEIHMFDPLEVAGQHRMGNFVIKRFKAKFDYTESYLINNKQPFVICDDTWSHAQPVHHSVGSKCTYHTDIIPFVSSKFVLDYNRKKSTITMRYGGPHHKDIFCTGEAIGGGLITTRNDTWYIHGSSSKFGAYSADMVSKCMGNRRFSFEDSSRGLSRSLVDPNRNLERNHASSRISMKYFGEDYPNSGNYRVIDQLYYSGVEQRLLYNVPPMNDFTLFGDGCHVCTHMGKICGSISTHLDIRPMLTMALGSIIGKTCSKVPGQHFSYIQEMVLSYLRTGNPIESVINKVCSTTGVDDLYVERVVAFLKNQGLVSVSYRKTQLKLKDFTHKCKSSQGAHNHDKNIYYNTNRTTYMQFHEDTMTYRFYDVTGRRVSHTLRTVELKGNPVSQIGKMDITAISALLRKRYRIVDLQKEIAVRYNVGSLFDKNSIYTLYIGNKPDPGYSEVLLINPNAEETYFVGQYYYLKRSQGLMHLYVKGTASDV